MMSAGAVGGTYEKGVQSKASGQIAKRKYQLKVKKGHTWCISEK